MFMYQRFFKRGFDIFFGVLGLIVLFPLMVVITVVILVVEGEFPCYSQVRLGKDLVPFTLFKFKTMRDERDNHGMLLPDDERITFLGSILRKSSLDELPQLFNVIMGDMSLVGPRPLLPEYQSLYSAEQLRRHAVLPGLTGWAQVNGRNAIRWQEKFEFDVWYVDNQDVWLDLKILGMTVVKVFGEGVSGGGVVSVRKFDGTN
jgi:lipopolysaccharide/colanic/teichoic acid biosynthesis glycosyltransferase